MVVVGVDQEVVEVEVGVKTFPSAHPREVVEVVNEDEVDHEVEENEDVVEVAQESSGKFTLA